MVKLSENHYKHKNYEINRTINLFGGNTFDVKWYTKSRNCNYNSLRADTLNGMVMLINQEVEHFKRLRA